MDRKPDAEVRRILRKEVGFRCPILGCGSPYLTWHHFDPPWNVKQHHIPSGMIALCREHHDKADAGAYTKEQLCEFKRASSKDTIAGQFDWMRNQILAIVGGNFYFENKIVVAYKDMPLIWFNRDDNGYLLLNVDMLSKENEPRLVIEDNFWIDMATAIDIECPPSGKLLKAEYSNGDRIKIEFFEINSSDDLKKRYPSVNIEILSPLLPITAVEITMNVHDTNISFSSKRTKIGTNTISGCMSMFGYIGLNISDA